MILFAQENKKVAKPGIVRKGHSEGALRRKRREINQSSASLIILSTLLEITCKSYGNASNNWLTLILQASPFFSTIFKILDSVLEICIKISLSNFLKEITAKSSQT